MSVKTVQLFTSIVQSAALSCDLMYTVFCVFLLHFPNPAQTPQHHNVRRRGDAENARLEFAAQTRSKMQGWKMQD